MKKVVKLKESDLQRIVKRVLKEQLRIKPKNVSEKEKEKNDLIKVLMDKLKFMLEGNKFTADDVCDVIINNCNHFKNKTDIFAEKGLADPRSQK
jgi:hypothetical protein